MPVEGLDHIAITVNDIEATVEWYQANRAWWEPLKQG